MQLSLRFRESLAFFTIKIYISQKSFTLIFQLINHVTPYSLLTWGTKSHKIEILQKKALGALHSKAAIRALILYSCPACFNFVSMSQ